MEREYLRGLGIEGLTDEVINGIMQEHGKSVENGKAKLTAATTQLTTAQEQLTAANGKIQEFESMDIETIKTEAANWKVKAEQAETEASAKIKELEYNNVLKEELSKPEYKFTSSYAKEGIFNEIKSKNLPLENGKIIGFDDVMKSIKEASPDAFIVGNNPPPMYGGSGDNSISQTEAEQIKEQYKKAQKNKDMAEMSRLTRYAHEKKIKLT